MQSVVELPFPIPVVQAVADAPSPLLVRLILPDDSIHSLSLAGSTMISSVLEEARRYMAVEGILASRYFGVTLDEESPFLLLSSSLSDCCEESIDLFIRSGSDLPGLTLYLTDRGSDASPAPGTSPSLSGIPMAFSDSADGRHDADMGESRNSDADADADADESAGLNAGGDRGIIFALSGDSEDSPHLAVCRWGIVLDGEIALKSRALRNEPPIRSVPKSLIRELRIDSFLEPAIDLQIARDVTVRSVHELLLRHFSVDVSRFRLFGNGVFLSDESIVANIILSIQFVTMVANSKAKPLEYGSDVQTLMRVTGAPRSICRRSLELYDYDIDRAKAALLTLPLPIDEAFSTETIIVDSDW
jgi:hypothetical protein